MTDNLENLAIEELAITNPTAYINSNPSPREWTMTPQDVARSLKLTAEDIKSLTQNKKDSWLGSLGRGVGEGIMGGLETISRTGAVEGLKHTYTSPNMTREEALRLLQDAEYTSHFLRNKKIAESAKTINHEFAYGFGNAIGSMIELVGVGFTTGVPGVMATVGSQSRSLVEETLVDTFVEKTGGIEGYTEEQKSKETLLANAYGVFSGLTEMLFGVEKLAGGAINGLTKANALSRLARSQGKLTKSALIKYGAQAGKSALGEATEEFIQNFGEDVIIAMAGHADTLTWDGVLKKALTGAMYGALIGGPVGMGLYRYNRKSIIDRIKKWSEEKELGLEEGQVVNMADEMLDSNRSTIVDEIATRAEIKNKYGQAYETLKVRIGEQIDATGTTPWTDQNKSREEYINAVAMTVTLPAIVQANRADLPLSEFLDTANIQVINNVLHFEPVTDINQLQTLLDQQNDIIAEQNRLAKLNNDDPAAKQNAQRRKAILQNAIRGMQLKNGIQTAARTRRKANADYITAQQLAPEQMGTIETAVEAQEEQEYVLFGGKKIPVEYQVVELADLQPSHINGTVNPNYSNKELQNRASRGTVQDVADLREKGQNITPERLLRGMTSAEGAPITNAQNEVIAGNGRTEIIRVAYENPETAARYRSALEKAGFSTEGMNQPVLIRKNTTMTTAEQVAAADISNISETSAFDEASQAKRDTQFLKDSETPLDFAAKLPMSERRGLMLNNGKWNMRKVQQRHEDALLSWICGNDTQLFEELVLNRGLTQKVIDVLTSNGATIYSLQETYPDTEIRQDIYNALVKMQRATRDNFLDITQTVELDGHDPMIENTLVWGFLYTNRSGNNLIIKNYATTLQENHQAVNNGADMFGNTVAPLSKKDAMIQALQAADEASAQMAADRGREYEGLFTETGEIKNPELAAAVVSYQNQFAGQDESTLFHLPPEMAKQADLAEEMARLDAENDPYEGETINIDGIERPTKNSTGKPIAKSEAALRNFWNWFGDSKVVDEQGRPLVVYHGARGRKNLTELDPKFGQNISAIYTATNRSAALHWTDWEDYSNKDLYPLYARIINPLIVDAKKQPYHSIEFKGIKTNTESIAEIAKNTGHDGLIVKNVYETDYENVLTDDVIVFEPNQIKSTDNKGTFSSKTANIYYQNQFAEQVELADENARLDDIYPEYKGKIINIDGKKRTVYNSNGERIAKSAEALRNFWNWFGDSKVVDDKGRPLVVYHGPRTEEKFSVFREGVAFFTDNRDVAQVFSDEYAYNLVVDGEKIPLDYDTAEHLSQWLSGYDYGIDDVIDWYNIADTIQERGQESYEEARDSGEFQSGNLDMVDLFNANDVHFEIGSQPMAMYLKIENPKIVDAKGQEWLAGKFDDSDLIDFSGGYDGSIVKNIREGGPTATMRGGLDVPIANDYIVYSNTQIKSTQNRGTFSPDTGNIYYQKGRGKPMGWYDPELQAIVLGKNWNETTIVHEFHHRYLEKIWGIYKEAQAGVRTVNQAWIEETEKLFEMLGIDPTQDQITVEQQEQFASMVESYITGLGVEKPETQAFTDFLNWVPEKYKSILNIGYLDKDGNIKNPILDEQSVAFFNRWFGNPALPSLPTAPAAQRMANPTDANGEIVPSTQKEMNNREKEWGQDSEEQSKADAQLWRAIGENTPTDMRAAVDAEEAIMKEEAKALPDDRVLPEEKKQTLRDRWFKTYQPDARERAADMARKYVKENPEHARELAFADPEIETEYDAPVDRGMLIRAVMETTAKGSDEWYILDNNLAVVKSMSASTLSLSGDISHRAYLDAKREVENARELKAAVNYAGTTRGAMDKWNSDIRDFISKRVGKIIATEANSEERKLAIKAFIEEAKTKFSGNTTNAILNQLDLTGYKTKSQQAFIKWAEKQIKQAAHAHIDAKEQAELMKASIKAQLAMTEIDSAQQDVNGNFARATAAGKDLRHWQFVKDKMKKAYIGRWGRFGIFIDNLFGSYAPSALLMSINTLFVANIPSTSINNSIVKSSAQKIYGKNAVDKTVLENEKKRIKQIFNASGINLAQMEKPTSPSVLHGEKYTQQEQSHWYDFVFKTLGWGDNLFRIPTFVDTLARIASKNANGDSAKATKLFREYTQINNASDEAKIARKQALAVANMGVFTQEGILASNLNHIRSSINKLSRGLVGLGPDGYGLGNLLAPFLKTGANMVEMGIRGSIAPVLQITTWAKKMQGKEITDLDKIALRVDWKYFAYTAVAMALFAALSNDDDDWYEEPYQTGHRYDPNKPYDSIKIGNAWIKLDIFGPFAIPIRVAARIIQRWEDGALTAIANGYGFGASEALSDLPLANQVTDNSMSYMAKQPGKWATGFLYNQANKLVPAQLKSIARAGSRATDTELDVSDLGQTIERKFHRNYGFDGEELTTNDIINLFTNRLKWGEE